MKKGASASPPQSLALRVEESLSEGERDSSSRSSSTEIPK
eukprot:CAMPEP_0176473108 /NCGR_PEP_ID=MMETSP0127-20121128/42117_1 /TAXON_ID=938130 /ORGANISM="Platyophrya macrostoma, Strain WH" /LENGTH=39 /DNA_ID= /DNA_START= /DNA_END= /DNA_ORIENTATION=